MTKFDATQEIYNQKMALFPLEIKYSVHKNFKKRQVTIAFKKI